MITVTTQNPFSSVAPSKCHPRILNQRKYNPLYHNLTFPIFSQTILPLNTMQY